MSKKIYPDARHHCTAFRVIEDGIDILRSNDDGEPSGTAGKPMLEALKGSQLQNVLFVAIRYFGGIKLGTGGLVSAYTKSVQKGIEECFKQNRVVEIISTKTYAFDVDINSYGKISAEIYNHNFNVIDTIFEHNFIRLILAINDVDFNQAVNVLSSIASKNIELIEYGVSTVELTVDCIT